MDKRIPVAVSSTGPVRSGRMEMKELEDSGGDGSEGGGGLL